MKPLFPRTMTTKESIPHFTITTNPKDFDFPYQASLQALQTDGILLPLSRICPKLGRTVRGHPARCGSAGCGQACAFHGFDQLRPKRRLVGTSLRVNTLATGPARCALTITASPIIARSSSGVATSPTGASYNARQPNNVSGFPPINPSKLRHGLS
jgi:hypothetical protein